MVTDQSYDSPKGVFVWSLSEISVDNTVFTRKLQESSPTLLELEMSSSQARIQQLNLSVHCHLWFNLTTNTKLIGKQVKEATIHCTSCPASFYILSDGHFSVSYEPLTGVSVHGAQIDAKDLECTPCPPGANCPGNDLTAKPNFWGSNTGNLMTMYQCPADYCCTTNCTSYNQCSGHRTGVLCGSCEENYSLSMLSSECINVESCDSHWLWPLVVLAATLYMGWYTFKNDVFAFPAFIARKLCKRFSKASDESDVYYIK